MKFNTQQKRRLSRAHGKLEAIETDKDLKRNNLTLCGYRTLIDVYNEIARCGASETVQHDVAEWFEKCGFGVERTAYSIYMITI